MITTLASDRNGNVLLLRNGAYQRQRSIPKDEMSVTTDVALVAASGAEIGTGPTTLFLAIRPGRRGRKTAQPS
jgi:hypothetical protein